MTFVELDKMLADKDSAKLSDKATVIRRVGADGISVKYYDVEVVKYHRDGSVELSTDGVRLRTLKKRINKYLPDGYKLKQKRFKWMLSSPYGEQEFSDFVRFDITKRDDKLDKPVPKMEGKEMSKGNITLEERIMRSAQASFSRYCGDLMEAGGLTGPQDPQADPGQAPTGTFPAPGANPGDDQMPGGPKTAETPKAGASDMGGDKTEEIKDEVYELMKEFGDASEGFLVKYFEEKGYKASDVKAALQSLQDEGKADQRSTWFLGVEEGPMDQQGDEAGVTPGNTEGDMAGGAPEAGTGGSPGAGAEGSPMSAMRNNAMRNNYNPNMDDGDFDDDGDEDDDDLDMDDDEIEVGDEDEIPGGHGGDHEEMEGDAVGEIKDDIRDAQALLKSILARLDDINGGHEDMGGEEDMGDMDFAAMRNHKRPAKNPMRGNYGYNDGDFGGDRYGASSRGTDPTGIRAMRRR